MSVDAVSEISDYSEVTEPESPFLSSNMSAPSWLMFQVAISSLFPPTCALRPIEDKGSISDSLKAANIDIFDRIPMKSSSFINGLRSVAAYAIGIYTPILSLSGACYHGYLAAKHLIEWLKGGEKVEHHWEKVSQYAHLLLEDLFYTLIPVFFGALVASQLTGSIAIVGGVLVGAFISAFMFGNTVLSPKSIAGLISEKNDLYGAYKSVFLRNEFGLVSAKDGALLSWDPAKDNDVFPVKHPYLKYSDMVELKGYFAELCINQGYKFLDLIQDLQKQLPENCKYQFSYPPSADKIADFLDKNQTHLKFDIEEWKQKFLTMYTNLKLAQDLISNGYSLVSSTAEWRGDILTTTTVTIELPFPLNEKACLAYLKK